MTIRADQSATQRDEPPAFDAEAFVRSVHAAGQRSCRGVIYNTADVLADLGRFAAELRPHLKGA